MDNIILNAITKYYAALEKTGYMSYNNVLALLVLCFFRDFVYHDYRANLSRGDYYTIERALNCLFGSNCLIPYPDYLKMGKLHIGEMTEMAQRVKTLEDTDVLKAFDADGTGDSDIFIVADEDTPVVEQVATPVITIALQTGRVSISCATSGATIYYTTNGDTPTTSSTQYTGTFAVTGTGVVKAIAVKAGMTNSDVASKNYQDIDPPFGPLNP